MERNREICTWSGTQLITYIIQTKHDEYYCGKTNNISERLTKHQKEKYPHWFSNTERKQWNHITIIVGDYEKKIKRFGSKNFMELVMSKW